MVQVLARGCKSLVYTGYFDREMFKVILGLLGAFRFPTIFYLEKGCPYIEANENLGLLGYVFSVYRILLPVRYLRLFCGLSVHSDFRQTFCFSQASRHREKRTKLGPLGQPFNAHRVHLRQLSIQGQLGYSVHFRFFATLCLENVSL